MNEHSCYICNESKCGAITLAQGRVAHVQCVLTRLAELEAIVEKIRVFADRIGEQHIDNAREAANQRDTYRDREQCFIARNFQSIVDLCNDSTRSAAEKANEKEHA